MKFIIRCAGIFFPIMAWAESGYIASDVEIIAVAHTGANAKTFTLRTANGTGICSGQNITFPLSAAGNSGNDEAIHNRAFSVALTALSIGSRVSIFSYEDSTVCNRAAYIEIFR